MGEKIDEDRSEGGRQHCIAETFKKIINLNKIAE